MEELDTEPTLFGIHFSLPLKHAFGNSTDEAYMHTRSDGRFFNITKLRAKTKVHKIIIRNMLFADDTAVTSHTEQDLQCLVDRVSQARKDFGLDYQMRPMFWARMWTHHLPSPPRTTSMKWYTSSPTLVPPLATTFP